MKDFITKAQHKAIAGRETARTAGGLKWLF